MKDKRNRGKKTLAAVGAVVAAGLTPGFIAASAAGAPLQGSNAGITAADVVAMDGNTYSFDELYAMQHGDTVGAQVELQEIQVVANMPRVTKYGAWLPSSHAEADGKGDTVYHAVEQMPKFPGGEAALKKYVDTHIIYPPMAVQNKVQGVVIVQFVVDKTGKVGEVKIARSVDKDLDREAIRVVKSLPQFIPGHQKGRTVSVWYTLPVEFKLK